MNGKIVGWRFVPKVKISDTSTLEPALMSNEAALGLLFCGRLLVAKNGCYE